MVKFYTTGCYNCNILKSKFKQKKISFNEEKDLNVILEKAAEYNIKSAPFCDIDGKIKTYEETLEWLGDK